MQVTKFNLVTDLKIMLSNVTHSHFYFECNKERGPIDQLYIELGLRQIFAKAKKYYLARPRPNLFYFFEQYYKYIGNRQNLKLMRKKDLQLQFHIN